MIPQTNHSEPDLDNEVSSIQVKNGCTLKAYQHINKTELLETITNDISLLKHNDQMSSFSCSCVGKFITLKLVFLECKLLGRTLFE